MLITGCLHSKLDPYNAQASCVCISFLEIHPYSTDCLVYKFIRWLVSGVGASFHCQRTIRLLVGSSSERSNFK